MKLVSLILLLFVMGCASPKPIMDYAIAQAAVEAAEASGAETYASGYWSKAEAYYSKAIKFYKLNSNDEAQTYFKKARRYAEKAETITKLKKFRSGEAGP